MNFKKNNALAGVDMIIAIVAVIFFTTLILTLMSTSAIKNLQTAKETLAMIYITETFENIGIASYDEVTEENKDVFIPQRAKEIYEIDMKIEDVEGQEDILKKVFVTFKYENSNKTYTCSMERFKMKE